MAYPKRYWKRIKNGERKLKVDSDNIKQCRWCGTHFNTLVRSSQFCSERCVKIVDNYGASMLSRKK